MWIIMRQRYLLQMTELKKISSDFEKNLKKQKQDSNVIVACKEELFKTKAQKLRLQLNQMRREKLIKKDISFSYLKPSNNKFHMFSICKSLWNIVEHFKEINVNKYKKNNS